METETILTIKDLQVVFHTYAGNVHAVNGVNLSLGTGEIIAIVGESGCGKSVTASAIMGLIPSPPGEITAGHIIFDGLDLTTLTVDQLRKLRGSQIGMVFQDPMTSLNPVLTIGTQLMESFTIHQNISKTEARCQAIEMLGLVGIPAPEKRIDQYPHQLSGGMRQRVMIAMALACKPRVLIADEPTTALDVTIQAQIIDLLKQLNKQLATSIILITHDLGVVAGFCSRVLVMYAGQVVEQATVNMLYTHPQHPYTWGLLKSVPRLDHPAAQLVSIPGQPPDLLTPPTGCPFAPRCTFAMEICKQQPPFNSITPTHFSRCWLGHPNSPHRPADLFRGGVAL